MRPPDILIQGTEQYDKWNNIPHYTQTEKYGRGPCEPSLTSYYAHHSQFSIKQNLQNIPSHNNPKENSSPKQLRANVCYLCYQNSTNHPRVTLLRNHTLRGQNRGQAYCDRRTFQSKVLSSMIGGTTSLTIPKLK